MSEQPSSTVPPVQSTSGTGATLDQVMAAIAGLTNSMTQSQAQTTAALQAQSQASAQAQVELQAQVTDLAKQLETFKDTVASTATDQVGNESDVGYTVRSHGFHNPSDDLMRGLIDRDRVGVVALRNLTSMTENADALMKEFLKYDAGVWARSLDHFHVVLPPISPRPGVTSVP